MTRDPVELMKSVLTRTGLPKTRVAMISGISPATIHSWLSGKRKPSASSLHQLADALEAHSADMRILADELREAAT